MKFVGIIGLMVVLGSFFQLSKTPHKYDFNEDGVVWVDDLMLYMIHTKDVKTNDLLDIIDNLTVGEVKSICQDDIDYYVAREGGRLVSAILYDSENNIVDGAYMFDSGTYILTLKWDKHGVISNKTIIYTKK